MKKNKISILFLILVLLLVGALSIACGQTTDDKMANYSEEEKIIVSFLNTVYSSTEEDVKKHSEFREYVDQLANSNLQSIELSEGNDYYIYLKNKYQLTDDLFDKLMANRQADYYIKKSFDEGVLYTPDEINLEYADSLKSYRYQVLMNGKTFKGIVRLDNKIIAGFELEVQ